LAIDEGVNETVAVQQQGETRTLLTNGHPMSGTAPGALRYMRAFAHVPLLMLEAPKRALLICFGVGNTAHSLLTHPSLESLEVADLSENVLEHARDFERWNHDPLKDPRVSVFVNDGRRLALLLALDLLADPARRELAGRVDDVAVTADGHDLLEADDKSALFRGVPTAWLDPCSSAPMFAGWNRPASLPPGLEARPNRSRRHPGRKSRPSRLSAGRRPSGSRSRSGSPP
jgi:hypothetical protein